MNAGGDVAWVCGVDEGRLERGEGAVEGREEGGDCEEGGVRVEEEGEDEWPVLDRLDECIDVEGQIAYGVYDGAESCLFCGSGWAVGGGGAVCDCALIVGGVGVVWRLNVVDGQVESTQ